MHLRAPLLRPIIVLTHGDEIVTTVPDMAAGPTVTQAREENIHKGECGMDQTRWDDNQPSQS